MKPKKNKTTLVVQDAMKAVAKDVIKPKVVRSGKVKPQLNEPNKKIDKIIINYDLIFKNKQLLNNPSFSSEPKYITIPPKEKGFAPQKILANFTPNPVTIIFVPTNKKLQKLKELLENMKHIDLIAVYKNGSKIRAFGFISEIKADSFTEEYSFNFTPNSFSFI